MKITKLKIENSQRSLLQTPEWSSFKSEHGWQSHQVNGWFVLERALPFGQRFLYAPELTLDLEHLPQFIAKVRQLGRARRAFVIRLEWLRVYNSSDAKHLKILGLRKAFEEVQPEFRQWIDLEGTEEEILARMKPKGRYNIQVATRKGIKVGDGTDPTPFLDLFRSTARRQSFTIRTDDYYADLIRLLQANDLGTLIVARFEGTPLAALIVSWFDGLATYLYGASSETERHLMAPYLAHWHAIQLAKQHSCQTYDLLAVSPQEAEGKRDSSGLPAEAQRAKAGVGEHRLAQLQTKYAGITRFKQQFGGDTVHLLGSWDLVLNPFIYQSFKFLETHRR